MTATRLPPAYRRCDNCGHRFTHHIERNGGRVCLDCPATRPCPRCTPATPTLFGA